MANTIRSGDREAINRIVQFYRQDEQQSRLRSFHDSLAVQLHAHTALKSSLHSIKTRIKDPEHLRDKLQRKAHEAAKAGKQFVYTERNLLSRVNDLVGVRLIHRHTTEFARIRERLVQFLVDEDYPLIEAFKARTWDDEYRDYFAGISVKAVRSRSMYTSVHCVIASNKRRSMTAELQIRTLSEELWGEVDHAINYPHPTDIVTCSEQLRVLARVTSSATRLVDSIFRSHEEAERRRSRVRKK